METYNRILGACTSLVAGTPVEAEFARLFQPLGYLSPVSSQFAVQIAGGRARSLLAQLSGWLWSWPSAEVLLDQLVTALETAEAVAEEPAEKARLRGLIDGLKGAGREIAVQIVSAYLVRQV